MIVISIISVVLFVFAVIYIIIEFLQRKNRISKDCFEVYTDMEFKLIFYLIFALMFTFFCCFIPFMSDGGISALIPCFIGQIVLTFLTINYFRPKIKVYNDSVSILSYFIYRTSFLKDIAEIKFKNNKIKLELKNGSSYSVSNYCKNFDKFIDFLKSKKISYDKNHISQIIQIHATLLTKILGIAISLAFIFAGILIITYYNKGQVIEIWPAYLLIALGVIVLTLFLLLSFRWKVNIDKYKIIYIPLIGKKRSYDTRTIINIHISTSYGYRGTKLKEISISLPKGHIIFPYRFAGVQQFIDTYKHKVIYDS